MSEFDQITPSDIERWRIALAQHEKWYNEADKKPISFVYLGSSSLKLLNEGIKEYIEKGYEPHGELIIDSQFIQAMVLYEAHSKEDQLKSPTEWDTTEFDKKQEELERLGFKREK